MLTVNELAIQANTAAHVVRYYTRIGLIEPSAQQENGYRLFSSRDANRLRFIRMPRPSRISGGRCTMRPP